MRLLGRPGGLPAGLLGLQPRLVGVLGGAQLVGDGPLCGRPLGGCGVDLLGGGGLRLLSLLGDPGPGLGHPLGVGQAGVGGGGLVGLGRGSLVGGQLGLEGGGGQRRGLQPGRLGVPAGDRGLLGGCRRPGQSGLGAGAGLVGLRGQPRVVGRGELGRGPLLGERGGGVVGRRAGLVGLAGEPGLLRGGLLGLLARRVRALGLGLGRLGGLGRGLVGGDRSYGGLLGLLATVVRGLRRPGALECGGLGLDPAGVSQGRGLRLLGGLLLGPAQSGRRLGGGGLGRRPLLVGGAGELGLGGRRLLGQHLGLVRGQRLPGMAPGRTPGHPPGPGPPARRPPRPRCDGSRPPPRPGPWSGRPPRRRHGPGGPRRR